MQKVKPQSRKNIRRIANWLKSELGLTIDEPVDVFHLMEKVLYKELEDYSFEVHTVEEMKEDEGKTYPSENRVLIREDVYELALEDDARARFTFIHELGHLVLHDQVPVYARNEEEVKKYEDPEWQADCFAGEFLMPLDGIKDLTVENIMQKYGVSRKAAECQKDKADMYFNDKMSLK